MKILVLKPSSLGDVVQALPVLRLLKLRWPQSSIYWWVETKLAPLLEGDPDLSGIVLFERHRWALPTQWPRTWNSIQWLRAQSFDLVIDLQSLARSGAFAWLANGKLLVGLDDAREGASGFYDIAVPRRSFHTHAVDWYLEVLRVLGVPVHWQFTWIPERPTVSQDIKRRWATEGSRWIALQPSARWANKRWPVNYYAELVQRLAADYPGFRIAILGDNADRELGARIAGAEPQRCLDLTGKISLPEMVEWIRLSELMIGNDTGPMHVAAALGKRVVAIFGPTEPRRTGPYGRLDGVLQQVKLSCVPCMKAYCSWPNPLECLHSIRPAAVLERIHQVLSGEGTARPLEASNTIRGDEPSPLRYES